MVFTIKRCSCEVKQTHAGKTLARTNPKEYERIVYGKPKTIGSFFDSVLSLFTSEVTRQVPRLQQIEAEIEEERKKQKNKAKKIITTASKK